jgi:hypothetical protein
VALDSRRHQVRATVAGVGPLRRAVRRIRRSDRLVAPEGLGLVHTPGTAVEDHARFDVVTREPRAIDLHPIMVKASGFGGQDASIFISARTAPRRRASCGARSTARPEQILK